MFFTCVPGTSIFFLFKWHNFRAQFDDSAFGTCLEILEFEIVS